MSQSHAVVLSGGGAFGAYGVGVLKALLHGHSGSTNGHSHEPDVFTGTSIGSFSAAYLVSRWGDYGAQSVDKLERVWLKRIAELGVKNGGFRIRLNPLDLLDPRAYLKNPLRPLMQLGGDTAHLTRKGVQRMAHLIAADQPLRERVLDLFDFGPFVEVEPWQRTIEETIDYGKIRASDKQLRIAATNWVDGVVEIFDNSDMTDERGPRVIRASSAVPGFYPPAKLGGQTYVDGGVLMNTPLKPALASGADVLHVIYVNDDVRKMPVDTFQTTFEMLYRSQIISWAAAIDRDIQRAASYNQGLDLLRRSKAGEELGNADLKAFVNSAGPIARDVAAAGKYRVATIHRYYPPRGLGGVLDFLNVTRGNLERLIEEGFANTVDHDCAANGCVLPTPNELES